MSLVLSDLPHNKEGELSGHRLINAKFPPIALFEDVANADEFDALYALQALTNPRLQTELGNLNLVPLGDIPFGIRGCHYATASFTHVNPDGSRFSNGEFGLMYIADTIETAILEVQYHQTLYWSRVPELDYERFVFKALTCRFNTGEGLDISHLPLKHPIYDLVDYGASRQLGSAIKQAPAYTCLSYRPVRHQAASCYALFTPKIVTDVIQSSHYEMIWSDNKLKAFNQLTQAPF